MPALRLNAISTVGAVIVVAILGGVLATTRCRQGAVALIALSALSTMLAPTPYHVSARAGAGKARSHSPKVEVANLVRGASNPVFRRCATAADVDSRRAPISSQ